MDKKTSPDADQEHYPLANTEVGKKINEKVVQKTGFEPSDLLEAPAKPPELKNVRRNFSALQFLLIIVGCILAAIGLFIWVYFASGIIGISLMVIGAISVVVGTLVRV